MDPMSHDQATVAEEEYLQIIYWLQEAGLPLTGANIARAMQVSAPTVHEMIGRLESDGYVTRAQNKSLKFTDSGREHASQIVRRHRLIERFLTDVFDIPWDQGTRRPSAWTLVSRWSGAICEGIGDPGRARPAPIFEGERDSVRWPTSRGRELARPSFRKNEAVILLHYSDTGPTPRTQAKSPGRLREMCSRRRAHYRSRAAGPDGVRVRTLHPRPLACRIICFWVKSVRR